MIIDCVADLHGFYPKLEDGDLLIIAGDLTARDTYDEYARFIDWVQNQTYERCIIVAGNHDNKLQEGFKPVFSWEDVELSQIDYLCDSGTEFEGLKIWGSPWTTTFPGINPHCCAFTVDTDEKLAEKWDLIPDDIDILVTHSPPYAILDHFYKKWGNSKKMKCVGSPGLREKIEKINPKLHVFGHIHEQGGKQVLLKGNFGISNTVCVNASIVNEHYQPVNKPVRIEL